MATLAGQSSNGNVVLKILFRARVRGLSIFEVCLSTFQPGLLMISLVERKRSRQITEYWGYRHETGYSQEKTTRRYRWRQPGLLHRRGSSHRCRTGWAGRSCRGRNVCRSATSRSIGASLVFETLLQEL